MHISLLRMCVYSKKKSFFDDENAFWHLTYTQKERHRDHQRQNRKRKKKKNWYVEQLSFYRIYYDDWLCYYSTTQIIEGKEEREWENAKEIIDSRVALPLERKYDELSAIIALLWSQKDRRINGNRRHDSEWQRKLVSIKEREKKRRRKSAFDVTIALLIVCLIEQLSCFLSALLSVSQSNHIKKEDATHLRRAFIFYS